MKTDEVYFVGTHKYSYKSGIPARIIGVEFATSEVGTPRLCYHIQWADKTEDWVAVEDYGNYRIVSFSDILAGNF